MQPWSVSCSKSRFGPRTGTCWRSTANPPASRSAQSRARSWVAAAAAAAFSRRVEAVCPGMDSGLGAPMGARGGMGGGSASSDDEGEVTWIYEKGPLTYMFLFNKDGRVIQISEYGYSSAFGTEHGVRLGDPIGKVYGA